MYPFKAQLLHELKPVDYTRRVQFCEDELTRIQVNTSHLEFLLFTDEFVFHLDLFSRRKSPCAVVAVRNRVKNRFEHHLDAVILPDFIVVGLDAASVS
ncbi:hypothetical protein HPB47_026209 [Ixodes persulcatus]|uniref:Uncharacterized protein n=1 Tax=Ixodes persulcatus TaxID=34615 RepID=A0AC60PZR0_IXOPE|nr:hypothetical protein HPB47_026209 [Ixodes persulcatus]